LESVAINKIKIVKKLCGAIEIYSEIQYEEIIKWEGVKNFEFSA